MKPELIDGLVALVDSQRGIVFTNANADSLKEALALAKAAIPSGQVAEDARSVTRELEQAVVPPAVAASLHRLAAKAQGYEQEHSLRMTRQTDADAANAAKEVALRERDEWKRKAGERAACALIEVKKREAAEARCAELESGRDALSEALNTHGQALATAEEELRRIKPFEALAKKRETALADTAATLSMYTSAWKRELGAFYRAKLHEIDGLVVSTRDMAEKAAEAEALHKERDAWRERTKAAEKRSNAHDMERNEAAFRMEVAERRVAELAAAGQVLSEHVAKAHGLPEIGVGITAEEVAAMSETDSATRWTLRDEFAKAALHGILANPTTQEKPDVCAKAAYIAADAMIKERKAK